MRQHSSLTSGKRPVEDEEKFEWHKKRELESRKGISSEDQRVLEEERRRHNQQELERIKRRREEREVESQRREQERDREQLEKEKASLGNWEEQERLFHLNQAYQKAYLRVRERRAKLLYLLALNTFRVKLGKEIVKEEEILILEDSSVCNDILRNITESSELEELLDELDDLFLPYEKDPKVLEFWRALQTAIDQRIQKLKSKNQSNNSKDALQSVKDDISAIFAGKSLQQLMELERGIRGKLMQPKVDSDYWTGLLKELGPLIVRVRVDELFRSLRNRLLDECEDYRLPVIKFTFDEYQNGKVYFKQKYSRPGESASKEIEPAQEESNKNVLINWDSCPAALQLLEQEQTRIVGRDELPFNNEAEDLMDLNRKPGWHERYSRVQPRHPRYFNRVRMNYEWNKYNQTHYDSANPPPKVVQGFRFNIFYPDLLDPASNSRAMPTYRLEADPTSEDNRIIRFVAGAPYEDLVFRIPAEEWDMSSKHGYKCVFERGALRLHFWFRSQRYRR